MKKRSIFTFCLVVVVAIALNLVAFLGLPGGLNAKYGGFTNSETGIKQGIDLAGGSVISFQADSENPTDEQMNTVRAIYETRLNSKGYTESRISVGEGGKITIEIPSAGMPEAEGEEVTGTAAAQTDDIVELLSAVAKLTFRDANGNVVVDGTEVKSAQSIYGRPGENAAMQYYIALEFNDEGAAKFADATEAAAASATPVIQIVMDEEVVSAPQVSERIAGGQCVITGSFTAEEAETLASQINSGNLPFSMTKISQETVGAELGENALDYSLIAAGIGVILVMLFMIWRYRLPGLIADLSLLIYVGLIALVMGVMHVNLSLPGIAGIVLSIGMAVDADCIIFERMKEELAVGKSIRAGVDAGFSKAFSAILDSNITTIISCIVLYMSGIGTVTGFAITLGIGVVLSMFTAIVITKFLLKTLVNIGIKNRNTFYNTKKKVDETKKPFDFAGNKVKFLLVPVIIIAVGVGAYFVRGGFNFDVEFAGGIRMQVDMNENVSNDEIAELVKDVTGLDAVVQKSETVGNSVIIKLPASEDDESNKNNVFAALQEKYELDETALVSAQSASPSFGKEVQGIALSYTLIALLCILIYIIIRFDWRSGLMAIAALAVNVLVMVAVYAISQIAINTTFIAAMLTVVGYSINNTIVIFDRIRENQKSRRRTETITEMTNRSVSETLGRTINSTITTLITVVLIYILGVSSIKQFALPLIIGIIIGAYTSIFFASTYWAAWKEAARAKKMK